MVLEEYFRGYATIDLDKIHRNVECMKKKLGHDTGIIAVIKTDGYGHGAVPIAKTLDDICYGYAVATVYEGHNLRRHGIIKPIFILGYTPENTYELIIKEKMIPAIFKIEDAKKLSAVATEFGVPADINIAVDTGMSRIGYIPDEEAVSEVIQIHKLPNVNIKSIFTHFAKADYQDKTFAYQQLKEFHAFINRIENEGVHIPIHQCANSAAMMEMPETSLNLSRAGISMYGLYPSEEMDHEAMKLEQAMSIYSHVVHVKEIEAGRGISYGQTFVAEKKMKIATIPIGYGDGYPRNLSNKGYVLIKGKRANIVGRVCMDQFMVDVTGMDVHVGDFVTLAGVDGEEETVLNNQIRMDDRKEILIDELAVMAGTFNYEFVCDLGKRIPRVYLKNGDIIGTKDYYNDDYEINI